MEGKCRKDCKYYSKEKGVFFCNSIAHPQPWRQFINCTFYVAKFKLRNLFGMKN